MDTLSYYAAQSPFTDPGDLSGLFTGLPKTVPELCRVVQGLCLDYEIRYKYPIVNERVIPTHVRYVSAVLKEITALDKSPLTEARPEVNRFLASSSDYANLLCSMARAQGIPARKRVGFTKGETYDSFELTEYWDGSAWKQADASELAKGEFLSAAEAWQAVRSGKLDAGLFRDKENSGLSVVRNNLLLDLAAMNKRELLNWDRYGWMLRPFEDFSDKAWEILDKAAELLLAGDGALDELAELYNREEGIQVPKVIRCETPLIPPHKAELTF